jgi:hypothetical protein
VTVRVRKKQQSGTRTASGGVRQPQTRHRHYNKQKRQDQTPGKLRHWWRQGSNKKDFPVGPTGFGGSRKFGDVMARIARSGWYLEGRFDEIEGKGHPRSVRGRRHLVSSHR